MSTVHYLHVLGHGVTLVFDDDGIMTTMNPYCLGDDKPVLHGVNEFKLDFVNGVRRADGSMYPRLDFEMENGQRLDGAVHIYETMHVIRGSWCWLAVRRGTDAIRDPFHARAFGHGIGRHWATRYYGHETGPIDYVTYDDQGVHVHDNKRGEHSSRYEWMLDWCSGAIMRTWDSTPFSVR